MKKIYIVLEWDEYSVKEEPLGAYLSKNKAQKEVEKLQKLSKYKVYHVTEVSLLDTKRKKKNGKS